jgi:hypothetical protein
LPARVSNEYQQTATTVVVVSGGNADMTFIGRSIDYGLASSGRLIKAVRIPDTPWRLAGILGLVALARHWAEPAKPNKRPIGEVRPTMFGGLRQPTLRGLATISGAACLAVARPTSQSSTQ